MYVILSFLMKNFLISDEKTRKKRNKMNTLNITMILHDVKQQKGDYHVFLTKKMNIFMGAYNV